jgi:hypothetical protein
MVIEKLAEAEFEAESVTLTAKLALPAIGAVPESTPPLDRLNPVAVNWLKPEVTVQVNPAPVPPEVISVCEYAVPP